MRPLNTEQFRTWSSGVEKQDYFTFTVIKIIITGGKNRKETQGKIFSGSRKRKKYCGQIVDFILRWRGRDLSRRN